MTTESTPIKPTPSALKSTTPPAAPAPSLYLTRHVGSQAPNRGTGGTTVETGFRDRFFRAADDDAACKGPKGERLPHNAGVWRLDPTAKAGHYRATALTDAAKSAGDLGLVAGPGVSS